MNVIIDSGGANLFSITTALERLGEKFIISAQQEIIKSATKLILPGVGAAREIMNNLKVSNLIETIKQSNTPLLGICLGQQILYEFSDEENTETLSIIPGRVVSFNKKNLTVPHMGWNTLLLPKKNPLFEGIPDQSYFYFVHSYYCPLSCETIGVTQYGVEFSAAVQKENFYGVQFHPEKSGELGERLLYNFIKNI